MHFVELGEAEEWVPAGVYPRAARSADPWAGTTAKVSSLLRLVAIVLLLLLAAFPARADDLAGAVAGLGGDSFVAKEKAIVALGKLGDPRAVPILKALSEDRLRKAPDGRVVIVNTIGGTTKLTDAASGQELPDLAPDPLDRIIVNNRLRNAIDGALGA